MKISTALASYDGARFIREQLDRNALTRRPLYDRLPEVYELLHFGGYRRSWGRKSALHDVVRSDRSS